MHIPFVDLKAQYNSIKADIDNAISSVIENTAFIGGKFVKEFETNFAKSYRVKHCIGTGNGTDAIYIVLRMLGIGSGDEVITTAFSWISTSETISQTGAKPVFVDIDPEYYTIDPDKIEAKITPRTKVVIPVHLYGQTADIDPIKTLSDKYNLDLIEDCAQAHFSKYRGQNVGTFGVAGTFSFYPGKILGAYGDAGCIITNDDEHAQNYRMFANHGMLAKHKHQFEGINSRLDGLQAAILNAKLPYLNQWTENRIENAQYYSGLLKDIPKIQTPKIRPESRHTFHVYVIKVANRDNLKSYLQKQGIETQLHYPKALPFLDAYNYLGLKRDDFPVSADHQDKILSLPLFPEMTKEQIEYVVDRICSYFSTKSS